jgi:uncharacterized membrane protein
MRIDLASSIGLGMVLLGATTLRGQVTILPGHDSTAGYTQAYDVNDAGLVVGSTYPVSPGPIDRGAFWTGTFLSLLPELPGSPSNSAQGTRGLGVNNAGSIVGVAAFAEPGADGSFAGRAVRWDNGVATDLGKLPGFQVGAARAINEAGQIAGTCVGGPSSAAVRWDAAGAIRRLDDLPGFSASASFDISPTGRVVGHSGIDQLDFAEERLPVVWDDTSPVALGMPATFNQGSAKGISAAGTIVGTVSNFDVDLLSTTDVRAAVWTESATDGGGPTLLPLLDGSLANEAVAINDIGMVIGASYETAESASFSFGGRPTLWIDDQPIDLVPLLADAFPSETAWTLTGINNAGLIVGNATLANATGDIVPFTLVVPEPTTLTSIVLAALLACRCRYGADGTARFCP